MKKFARCAVIVALASAAAPLMAAAQTTTPTGLTPAFGSGAGVNLQPIHSSGMFQRDRNVSVRERRRPDYEARGLREGPIWFYPKLETDFEYDDNIYPLLPAPKVSDTIFRVKPELDVQSNWSRHYFDVYARAAFNEYVSHGSESTTDWDVGSDYRIDVVRGTDVKFGAEDARLTEPRTSNGTQANAAKPVQFLAGLAYLLGEREVNRVKVSLRGDWSKFDFISVPAIGGGILNENFRDRQTYDVVGRAEYAVSPDTSVFVSGGGNWRKYRLAPTLAFNPLPRNSSGYQFLTGVNFDLTALLRGEIGVGYMSQTYDTSPFIPNPTGFSKYPDVSGVAAEAKVEWFPTRLTTVTASVNRTIEESAIINSGGFLATTAGLQIDHELLRNVIITGNGTFENDAYNGIDRTDHLYSAGLSATYLLNHNVGLNVGYTYYKQTSGGLAAGPTFDLNRATVGLVLQF